MNVLLRSRWLSQCKCFFKMVLNTVLGLALAFRSLYHAFVLCFAYSCMLCNLKLARIRISITIWLAFLSLSAFFCSWPNINDQRPMSINVIKLCLILFYHFICYLFILSNRDFKVPPLFSTFIHLLLVTDQDF